MNMNMINMHIYNHVHVYNCIIYHNYIYDYIYTHIVGDPYTLVTLGNLNNYHIWISLFGLILIGSLIYHKISGGILIGMF
jgi:hypothetical protein